MPNLHLPSWISVQFRWIDLGFFITLRHRFLAIHLGLVIGIHIHIGAGVAAYKRKHAHLG